MSKHTPGAWYVGRAESGYIVCNVGSLEVTTNEEDPEQYDVEADARLIAAAPELLEASEKVVALELDEINGDVADDLAHDLARTRAVESLVHIVSKAKGEQ